MNAKIVTPTNPSPTSSPVVYNKTCYQGFGASAAVQTAIGAYVDGTGRLVASDVNKPACVVLFFRQVNPSTGCYWWHERHVWTFTPWKGWERDRREIASGL